MGQQTAMICFLLAAIGIVLRDVRADSSLPVSRKGTRPPFKTIEEYNLFAPLENSHEVHIKKSKGGKGYRDDPFSDGAIPTKEPTKGMAKGSKAPTVESSKKTKVPTEKQTKAPSVSPPLKATKSPTAVKMTKSPSNLPTKAPKSSGKEPPSFDIGTGNSTDTPSGKGKGKGDDFPNKKDKSGKNSKGSDKLSGSSKSTKKGMKGDGAPVAQPTASPVFRTFAPFPTIPIPTRSPSSEPPTFDGNSVALAPFSLFYDIDQIPLEREVLEVVILTEDYVDDFFRQQLDDLLGVATSLTERKFTFNQPYRISYQSIATFLGNPPPASELNALLADAFSGENLDAYVASLKQLENNVFSNTDEVEEEIQPEPSERILGSNTTFILTAASAGAFILVVFGAIVYRRKKTYKPLGEVEKLHPGHMTVAGDTYTAGSTLSPGPEGDEKAYASAEEAPHDVHADEYPPDDGLQGFGSRLDDVTEAASSPYIEDEEIDELGDQRASCLATESEDENVPMRVVDLVRLFGR